MPLLRAYWTATTGSALQATLVVPIDAAVQNGDVMYLFTQAPSVDTVSLPGWTLLRTDTPGVSLEGHLFRRVANNEPASYTITYSNTRAYSAEVVALSGADTTTPENAIAGAAFASSTTFASPSVTTTVAGTTILVFGAGTYAIGLTPGTTSTPGVMSKLGEDVTTTTTSQNRQVSAFQTTQAAAGTFAAQTFNFTVASVAVLQTVAVAPATSTTVDAAAAWSGTATTTFNAVIVANPTTVTKTAGVSAVTMLRSVLGVSVGAVLSGSATTVAYTQATFHKVHGKTSSGAQFRLERNLRYGNAGFAFTETLPQDEAYIFPPENTKELWNRTREMADRYGYEVRFDEAGHLTLQPRNAPHQRVDFTTGDFTQLPVGLQTLPHVAAFGGTYLEWTSGAFTIVRQVQAARIDLVFPRGANLGAFTVTVQRVSDNATVAVGTVTPAATTTQFYYDQRMTPDGVNSCVSTVYSGALDTYRVTLTASGATSLVRRLDCLLLYYIDPATPLLSQVLDTADTALDIQPRSAMDDMRNMVTVVGRRKASLTDSEKLGNNPENPEGEFVVERQVVTPSIVDPTADTFIGYPKESVIYDEKITDPDMAQYLANAFTFRYRAPWSDATVDHTLLPMVQLRDPLYLNEARHKTITTGVVRYASAITHRLMETTAKTTVETTAYADFAAYEPREDVDIDTYFGGQPVANVALTYTALTGQTVTNLPLRSVKEYAIGEARTGVATITAGSPPYLDLGAVPWPPIPGTVQVGPVNLQIPDAALPYYLPLFVDAQTYVNTQQAAYTDPVKGTKTPITGGFTLPKNGVIDLHLGLTFDVSALEVQTLSITKESEWLEVTLPDGSTRQEISYWYRISAGPVYTATSTNNGVAPFYYEWYPDTQNLRVGRNGGDDRGGLDTYILKATYRSMIGTGGQPWLADTPYHHVTNVVYNTAMKRIYLPWKEGDGSQPYTMPSTLTQLQYRYRPYYPGGGSTDPYNGVSPFYDPYTSEIGYLVTAQFDALVSGFYRVSVRAFDQEKAWQDSTVIAWLTNPTADADDAEAHWNFMQAGTKEFTWDGVDQRGEWNAYQSEYYAIQAQGVFELGEKPVVGKGFYAWNREHIGGAPAPTAFIADVRDAQGKPIFGQGTYGAWFLVVECKNATLKRIAYDPVNAADETKRQYPRVAATGGAQPVKLYGPNNGGVTEAYAFTHLGVPTRCTLEAKDWTAGAAFNDQDTTAVTTEANWTAPTAGVPVDTDATLHNEKPVRLRLVVEDRPGTLWTGKQGEAQVLVHRHVHLKAGIMDQFFQFAGVNYPDTNTEQRTLVSRRMFNDRHTLVWKDTNFRRAATLKSSTYPTGTAEWIFIPRYFRKQFRLSGVTESLRFGDYLQLEEVPGWDASKQLAGKRARLHLAFMAYLFYLSAYTQDRSGRYTWAINRTFLDQSKIIKNAYGDWFDPASATTPPAAATSSTYRTEWPVDYMTQHRRTVVVRQWTNEPGWQVAQRTKFGFTVGSVGDKLLRHKWQDHEPTSTTLNGAAWPALSPDYHTQYHRDVANNDGLRLPAGYAADRQLGNGTISQLGNWAWEAGPLWVPCVGRDFHPYYKLPPMASPAKTGPTQSNYDWRTANIYAFVDRNKSQQYSENKGQTVGDDPAALEIWATATFDHTETYNISANAAGTRFWPNSQVKYKAQPTPAVQSNVFDYIRQEDNFTHYEELRGMYSVGKKPQQQPIKLSPGSPYYVNTMEYYRIESARNPWQTVYPAYNAFVSKFFTMKFRTEYYWESGTLFPVKKYGQEFLPAVNVDWTRYDTNDVNLRTELYYDSGAWTGWKDDVSTSGVADPNYKLWCTLATVFSEDGQPIAVGPRLPVTKDMYYHLVLVPERRGDV